MAAPAELEAIAEQVEGGDAPVATFREVLRWFSLAGPTVTGLWRIRNELEQLGLLTIPALDEARLDTPLTFRRNGVTPAAPRPHAPAPRARMLVAPPTAVEARARSGDPTLRLAHLVEVREPLVSVGPDDPLEKAASQLMLRHRDVIAVLKGPRTAVGVVGWRHLGEARLRIPAPVRVLECTQGVEVCPDDASLLDVLPLAERDGAVLVHAPDRTITALLTAADLARALHRIASPFLLLDEIEQRLRQLLDTRLPGVLAQHARNGAGASFGDYLRVLENPAHWERLGLPVDRALVVQQLDQVRLVRNRCMHFSPEGLDAQDVRALGEFLAFLRKLSAR